MDDTTYTNSAHSSWEEHYALSRHWASDLEFYRDDLRFLHKLIDKYFIWITNKENIESVRRIGSSILSLEAECRELMVDVKTHLSHLVERIENPEREGGDSVVKEHARLEKHMADFVKSFRMNRKEVFSITEHVVDSEKLAHLLES